MSRTFRTVGRSGLVVSPFALGTMTFGAQGWGSTDDVSQAIFDAYIESGGSFIDTADVYAGGRSEELVGGFIAERRLRDSVVLATRFSFNPEDGNPNTGGNGRKNMYRALDGSLRRLGTDYVDLYYTHIWDTVTPVEEVLQSLGDLVRAGKIRYFAFSNVPAWYAAKAATLAAAHAIPGPIALQLEYSLVERGIEREHAGAAAECGLGICPWGPLAAGFLSGKYHRDGTAIAGTGRFESRKPFREFTDRHWATLDALRSIAAGLNRPPSQVALAWAAAQPGITALILGAKTLDQLRDNVASLDLELPPDALRALSEVSKPESSLASGGFTPEITRMIFGDVDVVRPG